MNHLQNFRLARYHVILTALSTIVNAPLRRLHTPRRIRTRLPKDGLHPRSHRLPGLHTQSRLPIPLHLRDRPIRGCPTTANLRRCPQTLCHRSVEHARRIPTRRILCVPSHPHRTRHRLPPLLPCQLPRTGRDWHRQGTRTLPTDPSPDR